MAFEKKGMDPRGSLFLILLTLRLIVATNIDCNGKPFHCMNSTHFMICVDIGGGLSSTIDDFILPCPEPTICDQNNPFECEFPPASASTQLGSLQDSTSTTPSSILNTIWIEETINTLSPTTSDSFSHQSTTNTNVNDVTFDANTSSVLPMETTTETFTKETTNFVSATTDEGLDMTNMVITDATIIGDTTYVTDLPSTNDVGTKPVIRTTSLENMQTINSNIDESITTVTILTTVLPDEITSEISIKGSTNTINPIASDKLPTSNTDIDDIIITEVPEFITSKANSQESNKDVNQPVTSIDSSVTTALSPEITTEAIFNGITNSGVPTNNTNTTVNDVNSTEKPVHTTSLPEMTTINVWTEPTIKTPSVTTSEIDLLTISTKPKSTDPILTTVLLDKITSEVVIEGSTNIIHPVTSDNLPTPNITEVIITEIPEFLTSKSNSQESNKDVNQPVTSIDSSVATALSPEITTEAILNGITNSGVPTSDDILNNTNTTVNDVNSTEKPVHTTSLPEMTTINVWTEPAIKTPSVTTPEIDLLTSTKPKSTDPILTTVLLDKMTSEVVIEGSTNIIHPVTSDNLPTPNKTDVIITDVPEILTSKANLHTTNKDVHEPIISIDSSFTTALSPEITTEGILNGTMNSDIPLSNDIPNITSTTVNNVKPAEKPDYTTSLPEMFTTNVWSEPTINTPSVTMSEIDLLTTSTNPILTTVLPDEITSEVSIKGSMNTINPITSENLPTSNITDVIITDVPEYLTSKANLHTTNKDVNKPVTNIDSNFTTALSPEITTEVILNKIKNSDIPTYNDTLNITSPIVNDVKPTEELGDTTSSPEKKISNLWIELTINTPSVIPSQTNLLTSSRKGKSNDPNVTTVLTDEITTEDSIKGSTNTIHPIASDNLPTLNTNINDVIITDVPEFLTSKTNLQSSNINDPVTSVDFSLTTEITTEVVGIMSNNSSITNIFLNLTSDTISDEEITLASVRTTDFSSTIVTDALIVSTTSSILSQDIHISNTNIHEHVINSEPILSTTLLPTITTDVIGISNAGSSASNNDLDFTSGTVNYDKTIPDSNQATDLPETIITNEWKTATISTLKPILTQDMRNSNKNSNHFVTDIKNSDSSRDIDNAVLNLTSDTTIHDEVSPDSMKATDIPTTIIIDAWTKPIISTIWPIPTQDIPTSDTNINERVINNEPMISTALLPKLVTEVDDITNARSLIMNDDLNLTITAVNDNKITTDSIQSTESTITTITDPWTKLNIISPKPSRKTQTSNTNIKEHYVSTKPTLDSKWPLAITSGAVEITNSGRSPSKEDLNLISTTIDDYDSWNLIQITDLPTIATITDIWTKSTLNTLNPITTVDKLSTWNTDIYDPVVNSDSTTMVPLEFSTEASTKEIMSTFDLISNNAPYVANSNMDNSKVAFDTFTSINNNEWKKPTIGLLSESTTIDTLHSLSKDKAGPLTNNNKILTMTLLSGITTEQFMNKISSNVDPTTDVIGISKTTFSDYQVMRDSSDTTDLAETIAIELNANANEPVSSADKYVTAALQPETTTRMLIERKTSETYNNVVELISGINYPKMTIESIHTTDLPSTQNNYARTTPTVNNLRPTTFASLQSTSKTIISESVGTTLSASIQDLTLEKLPETINKNITKFVNSSLSETLIINNVTLNEPIITTNSINNNDLATTISNNSWASSTVGTLKPPLSNDVLQSSNTNTGNSKEISNSNLPSDVLQNIHNLGYETSLDQLNMPKINEGLSSNSNTSSTNKIISTDELMFYLTIINATSPLTDNVSTKDDTEQTHIKTIMTNSLSNRSTKILETNTLKPSPTNYSGSLMESKLLDRADISSKTSNDLENSEITTETSMYLETYKSKIDKTTYGERVTSEIPPLFNRWKQYSNEDLFTTEASTLAVYSDSTKNVKEDAKLTPYSLSENVPKILDKIFNTGFVSQTSTENNDTTINNKVRYLNISNIKENDASLKLSIPSSAVNDIKVPLSININSVPINNPLVKLSTEPETNSWNTISNSSYIITNKMTNQYVTNTLDYSLRNNTNNINVSINSKRKNDSQPIENKSYSNTRVLHVNRTDASIVNFNCAHHKRGQYADSKDCRKFYTCIGRREPIVGKCPVNTVFSEIWKQCTKNLSHCVRNRQFQCISQGRFSDVLLDSVYYVCIQSGSRSFYRIKLKCLDGYHFNKTTVSCTPNTNEATEPTSSEADTVSTVSDKSSTTTTDESEKSTKTEFHCKEEGVFADPTSCRNYYICTKRNKSQYKRKRKKCESDEVFHKDEKKCVGADSYEC